MKNVWECIDKHYDQINEPEFCVVMIRAGDPILWNAQRQKFYPWLFLPKPRPEQLVFHYDKRKDSILRLWSLPSAKVMATLSESSYVDRKWILTKSWCDAFFYGFTHDKKRCEIRNLLINEYTYVENHHPNFFFQWIRHLNGITLESESEYLNANRAELIKAGCNQVEGNPSDPFDFSKIAVEKVIDKPKSLSQ